MWNIPESLLDRRKNLQQCYMDLRLIFIYPVFIYSFWNLWPESIVWFAEKLLLPPQSKKKRKTSFCHPGSHSELPLYTMHPPHLAVAVASAEHTCSPGTKFCLWLPVVCFVQLCRCTMANTDRTERLWSLELVPCASYSRSITSHELKEFRVWWRSGRKLLLPPAVALSNFLEQPISFSPKLHLFESE